MITVMVDVTHLMEVKSSFKHNKVTDGDVNRLLMFYLNRTYGLLGDHLINLSEKDDPLIYTIMFGQLSCGIIPNMFKTVVDTAKNHQLSKMNICISNNDAYIHLS